MAAWASGRRCTKSGPKPGSSAASRACWPCPFQGSDDWPPGQSWVHKTANVLNKLPSSVQGKAKKDLHAIYQAETRETAEQAFDRFIAKYGTKHDKAAACLIKDRVALLAFYDFPAEHWKHLRTSNPIESTFATVRLRTDKTKGCLSRDTALAPPGPAGPVSFGDRRKGLLAFAGFQARQVGRASLAQARRRQPPRPAHRGRQVSQRRAHSRCRGQSRRMTSYTKIDHSSG